MESDFFVGSDGVLQATNNDPHVLQIIPVQDRLAYGWIFPKKEHLAIGVAGGAIHMQPLRPIFESFRKSLEKRLDIELESQKRRTHFIGGWGLKNQNVTERVMLIGDAAGWVDPMMGEGISYAMNSGVISAQVARDAIESDRYDSRFLEQYHQRCAHDCADNFVMAAWAGSRGIDFAESLLVRATRLDIASDLMAMVARGEIRYSDIPSRVIRELPRKLPSIIRQIVTERISSVVEKSS
jgi:flavin-dependent dehydrogenase